jgi:signal transduction histidine kinase
MATGLYSNLQSLAQESMQQVSAIRDLNENLEQLVKSRTAELEQSNRDKDRILGTIAYDVNNRLGGIAGFLNLLFEYYQQLSDKERLEYIRIAKESSFLSVDLVHDLLEFARSKADERTMSTETVDIWSFVRSAIECHCPKAVEKKIALTMGRAPLNLLCAVNKVRFSRVIDNLVTNAVKYTPQGGAVTVDIDEQAHSALVCVRDTGIGIPEVLRKHLFEPFTTSGRAGTAQETSTGLGLSIAKEIVEAHGGRIWFESEEKKGTSFYVKLPAVPATG